MFLCFKPAGFLRYCRFASLYLTCLNANPVNGKGRERLPRRNKFTICNNFFMILSSFLYSFYGVVKFLVLFLHGRTRALYYHCTSAAISFCNCSAEYRMKRLFFGIPRPGEVVHQHSAFLARQDIHGTAFQDHAEIENTSFILFRSLLRQLVINNIAVDLPCAP